MGIENWLYEIRPHKILSKRIIVQCAMCECMCECIVCNSGAPRLIWARQGQLFYLNFWTSCFFYERTGKSLSEALLFASINPQYDDRLFIELQIQYMKISSSNLERTSCVQKLFLTFRTIFVHNMFSPCSAKRGVSDKDLPVTL